jgi:hypothetical protein
LEQIALPYFWISKEEREEWAQSGMSMADWHKRRTKDMADQIKAAGLAKNRLSTNPLWPAVQHWLPSVFPKMNRADYKVDFGYEADLAQGTSFCAVLSLYMASGPEEFNWELHVSPLGVLIGRPVTIKEVSRQLSGEGPQPEIKGEYLAGIFRTAADVERLATVLAGLRWPKPPI